jgi:hypothetical protein
MNAPAFTGPKSDLNLVTACVRAALYSFVLWSLVRYKRSNWESARKCTRSLCLQALCATHATQRSRLPRSATITKRATYNERTKVQMNIPARCERHIAPPGYQRLQRAGKAAIGARRTVLLFMISNGLDQYIT